MLNEYLADLVSMFCFVCGSSNFLIILGYLLNVRKTGKPMLKKTFINAEQQLRMIFGYGRAEETGAVNKFSWGGV
jgi:hypothetical protein